MVKKLTFNIPKSNDRSVFSLEKNKNVKN